MESASKGITYKLFTGFSVNSELRMHMRLSPKWKEHQIVKPFEVMLVRYQDKEYLGCYIEHPQITLPSLEKVENQLRKEIQDIFPKYPLDAHKLYLFSQAFIL